MNDTRYCNNDDDDDYDGRGRGHKGDDDRDYGRRHHSSASHFQATSVTTVSFSNDPDFQPGRGRNQPTVDSVVFSGIGKWNGRTGYTFVATATDQGEPGRRRDTFSLVVKDSAGRIVAQVDDALDGGNIQSLRLPGRR